MVYALGGTDTGLLVMLTQERRQAQGLEVMSRCCQTNSNSSQLGQGGRLLCHAKTAPLDKSSGSVLFENLSAGEASFRIEVVEN